MIENGTKSKVACPKIKEYLEQALEGSRNSSIILQYRWETKMLEPVRVVSYKDIPGLRVPKAILSNLRIQGCYYNAYCTVKKIPGIRYVEGYLHDFITYPHAWNEFEGWHFDLTQEILWNEVGGEHAQIANISLEQLEEYYQITREKGNNLLWNPCTYLRVAA